MPEKLSPLSAVGHGPGSQGFFGIPIEFPAKTLFQIGAGMEPKKLSGPGGIDKAARLPIRLGHVPGKPTLKAG